MITGFLVFAACLVCGAGGYYLAEWMTRQMIDWLLEKISERRVLEIASRPISDQLKTMRWQLADLAARLPPPPKKEEPANGREKTPA